MTTAADTLSAAVAASDARYEADVAEAMKLISSACYKFTGQRRALIAALQSAAYRETMILVGGHGGVTFGPAPR